MEQFDHHPISHYRPQLRRETVTRLGSRAPKFTSTPVNTLYNCTTIKVMWKFSSFFCSQVGASLRACARRTLPFFVRAKSFRPTVPPRRRRVAAAGWPAPLQPGAVLARHGHFQTTGPQPGDTARSSSTSTRVIVDFWCSCSKGASIRM